MRQQRHPPQWLLRVRKIEKFIRWFAEPEILAVLRDADDLDQRSLIVADAESLTERRLPRPVMAGDLLVDDGNPRSCAGVGSEESTTGQNGHANRLEVIGTHIRRRDTDRSLASRKPVAFRRDFHDTGKTEIHRNRRRKRGGSDPWQLARTL